MSAPEVEATVDSVEGLGGFGGGCFGAARVDGECEEASELVVGGPGGAGARGVIDIGPRSRRRASCASGLRPGKRRFWGVRHRRAGGHRDRWRGRCSIGGIDRRPAEFVDRAALLRLPPQDLQRTRRGPVRKSSLQQDGSHVACSWSHCDKQTRVAPLAPGYCSSCVTGRGRYLRVLRKGIPRGFPSVQTARSSRWMPRSERRLRPERARRERVRWGGGRR